jgi:hypothetical protein
MKQKLIFLLLLVVVIKSVKVGSCEETISSDIAKLSFCNITNPPPQLKWSVNVTLLKDYDWKAGEDVKYLYLSSNDEINIVDNCFTGQTISGKYKKGTVLLIEQVCFLFKPNLKSGDKLYLVLFWSQPDSRQIIYLPFSNIKENEDHLGRQNLLKRISNLAINV